MVIQQEMDQDRGLAADLVAGLAVDLVRALKLVFFVALFLSGSVFSQEPFYSFALPKKWEMVCVKKFPKTIKMGCIAKCGKAFKPSINLAVEPTKASFTEYLEAVKLQQMANRKNSYETLGYVETLSGKAHIAQIDTKTACGDVRSLQCTLVKDSYAYTLTATALKEDFLDYHMEFLGAFESLEITNSFLDCLSCGKTKQGLEAKIAKIRADWESYLKGKDLSKKSPLELFTQKSFQKKYWRSFEKALSKVFEDKGLYFQIQASSEIKDTLLTASNS